jgi:hypothetical protein
LKITLVIATILSLCAISFLVYGNSAANFTVYAQSNLQTIKYRNLVIDLGNGLKTNAQLTIPAVGEGPFPSVLLVHGTTNRSTTQQLDPQYNTNKDVYISINNELKPKLVEQLNSASVVTPDKKCTGPCPIWIKSHYAIEPTLNIIGKCSSSD